MADSQRKTYTTLFKLAGQMDSSFSTVFNAANQNVAALKRNIGDLNDIHFGSTGTGGGDGSWFNYDHWYNGQHIGRDEYITQYYELLNQRDEEEQLIQRNIGDLNDIHFGSTGTGGGEGSWFNYDHWYNGQHIGRDEYITQYYELLNQREEEEQLIQEIREAEEAEAAAREQNAAAAVAAYAATAAAASEVLGVVKDIYVSVMDTTAQYEYTMSEVEALSGAYGAELDALNEKARDLGENTVFTARQSADAMTFMAQAGWDTTEMLSGMDGVIALAAASGTDLATTSTIVADTLAGFRMEASETSRMADVLAQTASASNTNVELLGETYKSVAAVAGMLGFTIEDVSAALGIMANNGIKGSRAGTSLRNILNGLAGDATLTAEAFGEVQITMFNEDGTAKTFAQTLDELRGYFSQMTQKEQNANAKALAGMRGYNALIAVLGATTEEYEKMYAEIGNCAGAAQRMADVRLDNLQGDVTLLQSAWESLTLTAGEQWSPTARMVVQDLTGMVQWLNQASDGWIQVGESVLAFVAGAAGVITVVSAVAALKTVLQAVGTTLAIGSGPLGAAVVIGGLVATLLVAITHARGLQSETESAMKTHEELMKRVDETNASIREEWVSMSQNSAETQEMIDRFHELAEVENRSASQKLELATLVDALNERISDLGLSYDYLTDSISGATGSLQEWYDEQQKQERLQHYKDSYSSYMGNRSSLYSNVLSTQMEADKAKQLLDEALEANSRGAYLGNLDRLRSDYELKAAAAQEAMTKYRGNEQNMLHASEEFEALANGYSSAREYEYARRFGELSAGNTVTVENVTMNVDATGKDAEEFVEEVYDIMAAWDNGEVRYDN